jgi:hypothetical protein
VEYRVKENQSEDTRFLDVETLKDFSAEDLERLRREIRNLHRRVRQELDSRERYCAICGDPLGTSVYGLRYCSAWHSYLGDHKDTPQVTREEFERKRAVGRIRTIKNATRTASALSEHPGTKGVAQLRESLNRLRIRQVLNEFQTITGESLNKSIRDSRRLRATGQ